MHGPRTGALLGLALLACAPAPLRAQADPAADVRRTGDWVRPVGEHGNTAFTVEARGKPVAAMVSCDDRTPTTFSIYVERSGRARLERKLGEEPPLVQFRLDKEETRASVGERWRPIGRGAAVYVLQQPIDRNVMQGLRHGGQLTVYLRGLTLSTINTIDSLKFSLRGSAAALAALPCE